jgi:rubredoxin
MREPEKLKAVEELQAATTRGGRCWQCRSCGWIYDETVGQPADGIPPGMPWEDVPPGWICPECGARKTDFAMAASC